MTRRAALPDGAGMPRIAMYDTAPAEPETDEATQAVQTALDRRDNGGSQGR